MQQPRGRGSPSSWGRDARVRREGRKGQEKEKEMAGVELLLLQGLAGRAACPPARWTSSKDREEHDSPRLGKPSSKGSPWPGGLCRSTEAGPWVLTGNTFTIPNSLSPEQFPFSLSCDGCVVFVVFFLNKKKKRMRVDVFCVCVHLCTWVTAN